MGAEVSDVCDDAGVLEVDKCIVNNEAGKVVGVEDVEVSIGGSHGGKEGLRECMGVEGLEVLDLILAMSTEVVSVLTNLQVADILGHLWPLLFVRENKGVMVTTAGVILHPPLTWVAGVLILLVAVVGDGDVGGG